MIPMEFNYLLIVTIYFLPSIISIFNPKSSFFVIFVGNLLFSWTVIFWFGSLLWAFCDTQTIQKSDELENEISASNDKNSRKRNLVTYVEPLIKWWRL